MELHSLILGAMLVLAPNQDSAWMSMVAYDVELAASIGTRPFEGEASTEAAALALVAIADHEGDHFDPRVAQCKRRGDAGRSITLWQLMQGAAWGDLREGDLCGNGALAAWAALQVLHGYSQRCTKSSPQGYFHGYASGSCGRPSAAGRRLCARWERLLAWAGIEGASCASGGAVRFRGRRLDATHVAAADVVGEHIGHVYGALQVPKDPVHQAASSDRVLSLPNPNASALMMHRTIRE